MQLQLKWAALPIWLKNDRHEVIFRGIRPRLDLSITAYVGNIDSGDDLRLVEQV